RGERREVGPGWGRPAPAPPARPPAGRPLAWPSPSRSGMPSSTGGSARCCPPLASTSRLTRTPASTPVRCHWPISSSSTACLASPASMTRGTSSSTTCRAPRSMGRSQADVAATALVAGLACGAAASGAPTPVMTLLGVALFIAPGYVVGQLLVGSGVTGLERAAVIAGLTLAVPVLGGLLLYAAGVPLHRPGWLGLLAGVTLAGDVALFLRRRAGQAAPFRWQ